MACGLQRRRRKTVFDWTLYFSGLLITSLLLLLTWTVSLFKHDVSIVDSTWSLMFLGMALVYALLPGELSARGTLMLVLVVAWALRLSVYITWRNWGEGEDRRYQAMRRNHQPGFTFKSLYLVFGLQGLLAWFISLPLLAAATGAAPLGMLDAVAVLVWATGFAFESIADAQLAAFKARAGNRGKVLDTGLWRYTRHPNYFGECLIWWGFYLLALAAGGWWALPAPLLMTFLLLRVSGVALLERDISERRPTYRDYARTTNAFLPGPRKTTPATRACHGGTP
jgi:steroid 5-alpha reductase family enzyme